MKRIKNLGLWLSILVTVVIMMLKVPPMYKGILLALFIAGILFIRRGVFPYMKANKKATSVNPDDWQAAWPLYRKAIKAGVQKSFVITAASMFLQRGDREEGKRLLLDYLATSTGKDPTLDSVAKTMLSMAYWMEGDLERAIELVEEVHRHGQRDKNLYINYSTYLIAAGRLDEAQELINESHVQGQSSPGIIDNQAWILILDERWEEAEELLINLVARNPHFAEPYVHYAQILIHFGEVGLAIEQLERAVGCSFTNTSAMNKRTIEALLARLTDPATRIKSAKAIDRDREAVANGRMSAPIQGEFDPCEEPILSGFAKRKPLPKIVAKAEREPNLDLTEEDLKFIEEQERS